MSQNTTILVSKFAAEILDGAEHLFLRDPGLRTNVITEFDATLARLDAITLRAALYRRNVVLAKKQLEEGVL